MSDRPRKVVAEPRLVMLALVAVTVMMLGILAAGDGDALARDDEGRA